MTTKLEQFEDLPTEARSKKEPAINTAAAVTAVATVIYFVVKFFVPNADEGLLNTITVVVGLLLPLVTGYIIRSKVFAPATVREIVREAKTNVSSGRLSIAKEERPRGWNES